MDATGYAAAVLLLTPVAVLAIGGATHLARPAHLAEALAAGLPRAPVPHAALRPAALAWGVLELGTAAAAVTGFLLGRPAALVGGGAAAAVLYAGYTAWLSWLLVTAPGASCGCAGEAVPASGWTAGRAALLGLAAAAGAGLAPAAARPTGPTQAALLALSVGALAVLLWHLPAAVAPPPNREVTTT
jgi:hypothetical protein